MVGVTLLLLLSAMAGLAQVHRVVDVQRVPATGDPTSAIVSVSVPASPRVVRCDLLVAGAGAGGVAAALSAAKRGSTVCLTEETDVIGGQFHSTPALDEHKFIEVSGATRSYYEVRNGIREHYRKKYKLAAGLRAIDNLNPGSCYVSSLCYEPEVGVAVLQSMLAPYRSKVQTMLRTKVISADVSGGRVQSVLAYGFEAREVVRIVPRFVLDATETGDLLPLLKVPYTVGSEAKAVTGEPHAALAANPACVQSFTYTFAISYDTKGEHRVPKPAGYERIRDSQPFSLRINYPEENGWRGYFQYSMFGEDAPVPNNMSPKPFFNWRRLLARKTFEGVTSDVALMNWPKQDYHEESLLDRTPEDTVRVLQAAKNVSNSFLYWLQNDVPRDEGKGTGYPGFQLRKDVMGSEDGLSKYPYIRESRRIVAQGRVTEQDLRIDDASAVRAKPFTDSIGTGFYMVDIHPCGANERGTMMMPKPFQVPMSAMLPKGLTNFLPASKNLGVTHLTNGAFRLHPIEWNIGEVAGVMANMAVAAGSIPGANQVQREIIAAGVPVVWFDDLAVDDPAFAAVQLAAIRGLYPIDSHNLHASPASPVTRREAAVILCAFMGRSVGANEAIALAVKEGWMAVDHRNWFHADLPFYWTDWREDKFPKPLPELRATKTGPVKRSELAHRLSGL